MKQKRDCPPAKAGKRFEKSPAHYAGRHDCIPYHLGTAVSSTDSEVSGDSSIV